MPVVVTAANFDGDERRGLVVTVERAESRATISLLDLDLTEAPAAVTGSPPPTAAGSGSRRARRSPPGRGGVRTGCRDSAPSTVAAWLRRPIR